MRTVIVASWARMKHRPGPRGWYAPRDDDLDALSRNRAECEKAARDAIDVIDLEMRKSAYSKQQAQKYLVELLELTQQSRACKQLYVHFRLVSFAPVRRQQNGSSRILLTGLAVL